MGDPTFELDIVKHEQKPAELVLHMKGLNQAQAEEVSSLYQQMMADDQRAVKIGNDLDGSRTITASMASVEEAKRFFIVVKHASNPQLVEGIDHSFKPIAMYGMDPLIAFENPAQIRDHLEEQGKAFAKLQPQSSAKQ